MYPSVFVLSETKAQLEEAMAEIKMLAHKVRAKLKRKLPSLGDIPLT